MDLRGALGGLLSTASAARIEGVSNRGCLQNEDLRPKNEDPKTKTGFSYKSIKPETVKPGQRFSSDTK